MKKVRDRFIKNLHYLCLVGVIALGLMTIVGSSDGGGGGGGGEDLGTAPKINNVVLYDANWIATASFTIGDYGNFAVYVTDPDLDMINCYITQYYPHDSTTPYHGPDLMSLPSQSDVDMIYYSIDPSGVTGPAGSWRIEFQIEDSKGNESNVFRTYASIHE